MKNTCQKCTKPKTTAAPYGDRCQGYVDAAMVVLMSQRRITCRLAAELLRDGRLHPVGQQTWTCTSERDENVIYVATPYTCTCPAAVHNNNKVLCKHRLGAIVLAA